MIKKFENYKWQDTVDDIVTMFEDSIFEIDIKEETHATFITVITPYKKVLEEISKSISIYKKRHNDEHKSIGFSDIVFYVEYNTHKDIESYNEFVTDIINKINYIRKKLPNGVYDANYNISNILNDKDVLINSIISKKGIIVFGVKIIHTNIEKFETFTGLTPASGAPYFG